MRTNIPLILPICSILLWIGFACQESVDPPEPYGALPNEYQMDWHKMEYYMFVHFGPNTFTNVEWGDGKEDPNVFNPTDLDCRQWASIAKAAGMKGIIITAKHHDGFCLWPSEYSTHTVRESPWKNGEGDVLKELSEACREYGLQMGVYLSPWDQNHPAYGTEKYNQVFANTLTEVLSNYGHIFEQWFDGANGEGPNGKTQVYDWNLFHETVYRNQPHAIIFSDVGPGCRWMGNERGIAGETNWSTLNIEGFGPGHDAPPTYILNQGDMNAEAWVPAETDVSIRPGWFYSPQTDDRVKSVEHLVDIYYTSIGRNSNLLLNVPPDRRGRIHPNDSARLMEFRDVIDKTFKKDIARNASAKASSVRGSAYLAGNVLNGNYDSYWTVEEDILDPFLEISWRSRQTFNRLSLQEYIPLGQRVAAFTVQYWDKETSDWKELTKETTIGYKRILRFPAITTNKIRIQIEEALAPPVLNAVGIYKAPEFLSVPRILRDRQGKVTLTCDSPDPTIYYTTDGSEPTVSSTRYEGPFPFEGAGTIRAIAAIDNNKKISEVVSEDMEISAVKWSVISPDIDQQDRIIDGNSESAIRLDIEEPIIIGFGETLELKGFTYTPVNNLVVPNIVRFILSVSEDGKKWNTIIDKGVFNNIKNNPIRQEIRFDQPCSAAYMMVEVIETVGNADTYSIAGIGAITQ